VINPRSLDHYRIKSCLRQEKTKIARWEIEVREQDQSKRNPRQCKPLCSIQCQWFWVPIVLCLSRESWNLRRIAAFCDFFGSRRPDSSSSNRALLATMVMLVYGVIGCSPVARMGDAGDVDPDGHCRRPAGPSNQSRRMISTVRGACSSIGWHGRLQRGYQTRAAAQVYPGVPTEGSTG